MCLYKQSYVYLSLYSEIQYGHCYVHVYVFDIVSIKILQKKSRSNIKILGYVSKLRRLCPWPSAFHDQQTWRCEIGNHGSVSCPMGMVTAIRGTHF